jgi:DNA-binding response OmpR family regulator
VDKVKVLVVEDTPDLLALLSDRLNYEGYAVVKAADGQEAWEKIEKDDPDVVLLDLMMPKMDGYEVLKRLRQTPPTKKYQPVIIVSAKGELQDLHKGFTLEADHYITKPWEMNDILKGIKLVLKLAQFRAKEGDSQESH